RPFGFSARYHGSSFLPYASPASCRATGKPSSAAHQSTFCTLTEFVRPQIVSTAAVPGSVARQRAHDRRVLRIPREQHVAPRHLEVGEVEPRRDRAAAEDE